MLLNDILKLSSLGSSKLFELLKNNNIKLSKKVLNYSIKQVVITHILSSDDCFELRYDLDKIKAFTLSQLVDYLKANYVQVSVEDVLNNLWTVIASNLNRLEISQNELSSLLEQTDFQYETIDSLVANSKYTFFDGPNEVDGLDFLEAKKSYKLYGSVEFLTSELERLDVAIPRRVSKKEFLQRVLDALGTKAKENETKLINYSFDELVEFSTLNSLGLNTDLSQDDLIRILVNFYAENNTILTPVDYDVIKNLEYNKDDFQTLKTQPLTSDNEELLQSISDVLNNESDSEIDDILKELEEEEDILDEEEVEEVIPQLEKKEDDEEASYNLTGLFDDDLINSVLNDDVEPEKVIKPNYPEEFLNSTINDDGTLTRKDSPTNENQVFENKQEIEDLDSILNNFKVEDKKEIKKKKSNKTLVILLLVWLLIMIAIISIRII